MAIPLRVLMVEDSEGDAMLLLRELKRGGYDVTSTRVDTEDDMRTALVAETWDLITSDYSMPCFDTPAALAVLKRTGLDVPFIIVSGTIGEERAVAAMKAGAHDYIMKDNMARLLPAIERELREAKVRRGRRRAEESLRISHENLQQMLEGAVHALATTAEKRDPYTAGHQRRVAQLACATAKTMGLSEHQIRGIHIAGLLHDIGKVTVPAEILSKPGKLSESEFNIIRTHPAVAYDILKEIPFSWPVNQAVIQHHEALDGSGYPDGLSGQQIILEARILKVADVVEAISSHRPYRPALGIEAAINEIKKGEGVLYDPNVAQACLSLLHTGGFVFKQS